MRQNPVGEPAATAAWNFGTPRRRSSLKRLGPFCHCRQRQASIVALGGFAIEQEAEPFGMREIGALQVGLQLRECARHAGESELV